MSEQLVNVGHEVDKTPAGLKGTPPEARAIWGDDSDVGRQRVCEPRGLASAVVPSMQVEHGSAVPRSVLRPRESATVSEVDLLGSMLRHGPKGTDRPAARVEHMRSWPSRPRNALCGRAGSGSHQTTRKGKGGQIEPNPEEVQSQNHTQP